MSSTSQHRKSVAGTGWLDGAVAFLSYAYVAALIGTVLVLRFAGERFWMSGVALYLPRVVFGMPCLVLSPLLLWLRMPRLLWTQLAAAAIVVFPLMGFVVSGPRASAGGTTLRVLSYNVESCAGGEAALAQRIAQYAPDVVLLQELCGDPAALVELSRLFGAYQDGFSSVGWGFGYTFPSDKAWMRLDRILASQELRFVSFRVACGEESDHRCVLAQLERADGR